MPELKVVTRQSCKAFDTVTINTNHRLEYDNGHLKAVYPSHVDETEYQIAVFAVDDGTVQVPDNSAVIDVDGDSIVSLVPTVAYDDGGSE